MRSSVVKRDEEFEREACRLVARCENYRIYYSVVEPTSSRNWSTYDVDELVIFRERVENWKKLAWERCIVEVKEG